MHFGAEVPILFKAEASSFSSVGHVLPQTSTGPLPANAFAKGSSSLRNDLSDTIEPGIAADRNTIRIEAEEQVP